MSARGLVGFNVREKSKHRPEIPAKLVFKGADGTPDPRFNKYVSATLAGEDVQPETFGGTQRGPRARRAGRGTSSTPRPGRARSTSAPARTTSTRRAGPSTASSGSA
jgi:hypothetical protein